MSGIYPQVYRNGQWGYICTNNGYSNLGNVICRELGRSGASYTSYSYYNYPGYNLYYPTCTGQENYFIECNYERFETYLSYCSYRLRVSCQGKVPLLHQNFFNIFLIHTTRNIFRKFYIYFLAVLPEEKF